MKTNGNFSFKNKRPRVWVWLVVIPIVITFFSIKFLPPSLLFLPNLLLALFFILYFMKLVGKIRSEKS